MIGLNFSSHFMLRRTEALSDWFGSREEEGEEEEEEEGGGDGEEEEGKGKGKIELWHFLWRCRCRRYSGATIKVSHSIESYGGPETVACFTWRSAIRFYDLCITPWSRPYLASFTSSTIFSPFFSILSFHFFLILLFLLFLFVSVFFCIPVCVLRSNPTASMFPSGFRRNS